MNNDSWHEDLTVHLRLSLHAKVLGNQGPLPTAFGAYPFLYFEGVFQMLRKPSAKNSGHVSGPILEIQSPDAEMDSTCMFYFDNTWKFERTILKSQQCPWPHNVRSLGPFWRMNPQHGHPNPASYQYLIPGSPNPHNILGIKLDLSCLIYINIYICNPHISIHLHSSLSQAALLQEVCWQWRYLFRTCDGKPNWMG